MRVMIWTKDVVLFNWIVVFELRFSGFERENLRMPMNKKRVGKFDGGVFDRMGDSDIIRVGVKIMLGGL